MNSFYAGHVPMERSNSSTSNTNFELQMRVHIKAVSPQEDPASAELEHPDLPPIINAVLSEIAREMEKELNIELNILRPLKFHNDELHAEVDFGGRSKGLPVADVVKTFASLRKKYEQRTDVLLLKSLLFAGMIDVISIIAIIPGNLDIFHRPQVESKAQRDAPDSNNPSTSLAGVDGDQHGSQSKVPGFLETPHVVVIGFIFVRSPGCAFAGLECVRFCRKSVV
jgi:hypothetical protein